jgi:hypothetical protein
MSDGARAGRRSTIWHNVARPGTVQGARWVLRRVLRDPAGSTARVGSLVAATRRACDAREDLDGPGATWANVGARERDCGGALAVAPDARVQVAGFPEPALRPSAPESVDLGMTTEPSSSSKRQARPPTTRRSEATDSAPGPLDELAAALRARGAEFVVQGGAAEGFRWLEFGNEPALCLGVGDDGVLWWNVVQGGEMLEDGEIVEGSVEAVAAWVVERARGLGG